jgi:hypothetical protein
MELFWWLTAVYGSRVAVWFSYLVNPENHVNLVKLASKHFYKTTGLDKIFMMF